MGFAPDRQGWTMSARHVTSPQLVGHVARPARTWKERIMDKECFVGIDVSLKTSALCVVDRAGGVIAEVKAASEPEALFAAITQVGRPIAAIGLEAGPLSQFLWKGLTDAGLPVVLMETRRVKGALQAMPVKTDRRDALGIAQLLRMGWFRPVHCKSASAQELRAVLAARRTLMSKMLDIELSVRGILRGFGLKCQPASKIDPVSAPNFDPPLG